jgi:soluble lytic murein transglycosylase-like protein
VLELQKLLHPKAYKASFEELTAWLDRYGDIAGAERVRNLADRRRPGTSPASPSATTESRAAREAYYGGSITQALSLARAAGDRWIAGLASWRSGQKSEAQTHFAAVAQDPREDRWVRAGAAFWAARSADANGDTASARKFTVLASTWPDTFYGMIASHRLDVVTPAAVSQLGEARVFKASFSTNVPIPSDLIASNLPTGGTRNLAIVHRAEALAQIGRYNDAIVEARQGLGLASDRADRDMWMALIGQIESESGSANSIAFDLPDLAPQGGFTLPRALVYALVKQESQFNPWAVSKAGAIGLMQIRPVAAARAGGDDKLIANPMPLFDGPTNLRLGQDYLSWIMEATVGHDVLRAVAAYNAGPAPVLRTAKALGEDCDSLLLIESLPAGETRQYVEHVMANYWTYQKAMGHKPASLDALARGARETDIRLDH